MVRVLRSQSFVLPLVRCQVQQGEKVLSLGSSRLHFWRLCAFVVAGEDVGGLVCGALRECLDSHDVRDDNFHAEFMRRIAHTIEEALKLSCDLIQRWPLARVFAEHALYQALQLRWSLFQVELLLMRRCKTG